jgi:hypothetical protein
MTIKLFAFAKYLRQMANLTQNNKSLRQNFSQLLFGENSRKQLAQIDPRNRLLSNSRGKSLPEAV